MKSVIVASTNPVKLQAVRQGFARMFPAGHFSVCPLMVAAAVSDQPLTDGETRLGALARAIAAREKLPDAEFWVGIEGGVDQIDGHMAAFAWVAILSQSGEGFSRSGTFFLPEKIADLVRSGKELGEADDIIFGRANSKQQNGAIGLLSGDAIDRTGLYAQAVLLALIPFKSPEHFKT